jgi:hypothetical protein
LVFAALIGAFDRARRSSSSRPGEAGGLGGVVLADLVLEFFFFVTSFFLFGTFLVDSPPPP